MSFNAPFPPYPSIGELVTYQGSAYRWDGEYWWPYGTSSGYVLTGNSIGGGVNIVYQTTGDTLVFKSLVGAGVTDNGTTITITGGGGGSGSTTFTGGTVTGPTIFTNGLSANTISATTYLNLPVSGLTAGSNIGLTNNNGNYTISFTGTTGSNFTGGTVTGATIFTGGLSANTFSATTYLNLPSDIRVTGGTYSNGSTTFTNNTGGTFTITGFTTPFTGGTVTGATNFTGGLTATTISATTVLADNILKTVYRLPSSVALPVSTTTTAATISIPRTSVFSAQTLKVEGIFVGQQPTAAAKTIQLIWNNGLNPQSTSIATTSNTGSFGFLARITQSGVFFSRNAIYAASNQGSNTYSDVGGNILINVVINPSTSAATLEHLVVTLY